MSNPLHADYYADEAVSTTAEILENVQIAEHTYRLRFRAPEMASRVLPGQFLMVRLAGCDDPLIGRPFALYDVHDVDGQPSDVDFVYLVEGKLTSRLATIPRGQEVEVWGPLGNGFIPTDCKHLVMVAGGIGQTPFLAVAKERLGRRAFGRDAKPVDKATFVYGARTSGRLAGLDDFEATGLDLRIATDDGSRGHRGLVTDLLPELLAEDPAETHVVCCGPHPMMAAVSRVAQQHGVSCEVSLEEPMACGIGICFTCVAMIHQEDGTCDYKRTCVEGPVFPAGKVAWE